MLSGWWQCALATVTVSTGHWSVAGQPGVWSDCLLTVSIGQPGVWSDCLLTVSIGQPGVWSDCLLTVSIGQPEVGLTVS